MKPTYSFDKGLLHIATPGTEMRLRWKPTPFAEHRLHRGRWMSFRPEFRILAPKSPTPALPDNPEDRKTALEKQEAFRAFRPEVPAAVAELAERFGSCQWPLMLLAAECPAGLDLARSNPVLAYALANNEHFRATPADAAAFQAVRYCHRKQRQILKWLGFPDSEAMVRVVRKIPATVAYPSLLRMLRSAVIDPDTLKRMGHLPVINRGIVFLLSDRTLRGLATPALLHEISTAENELDQAPIADLMMDIHLMATEIQATDKLRPFASRRRVRECYDQLYTVHDDALEHIRLEDERMEQVRIARAEERRRIQRVQEEQRKKAARVRATQRQQAQQAQQERDRLQAEEWERQERRRAVERMEKARRLRFAPFPPPPIPGTKEIVPLTCSHALMDEGRAQQNCLGNNDEYADRVRNGTLYIYRVLAPQRATLAIARSGGSWRVSELKCRRNYLASGSTWDHIHAWLSAHQISL